jgi:hypothetical protein
MPEHGKRCIESPTGTHAEYSPVVPASGFHGANKEKGGNCKKATRSLAHFPP